MENTDGFVFADPFMAARFITELQMMGYRNREDWNDLHHPFESVSWDNICGIDTQSDNIACHPHDLCNKDKMHVNNERDYSRAVRICERRIKN